MGARAETVSGAAKGGAAVLRRLVDARGRSSRDPADQPKSTVKDARKQARSTLNGARKQARTTVRAAQREARKRTTKARVAAARARVGTKARRERVGTKAVAAAGAAGLAAGHFLDPDSGKRRRHIARDRALAVIRRSAESARREAAYVGGQVEGKIEAAKGKRSPEKPAPNDQVLADRVKSEIFQPEDAPKGSVNVNVEHGVVYLRGEVDRPDQIWKLIEQASSVDGVAGVENLLHTG